MYGTGFRALFLDTVPLAHGLKVAQGSGEFREWSGFLKQTIGIQIVGRVWMAVPVLLLLKLFLIFRVKASWRLAKKVSPPPRVGLCPLHWDHLSYYAGPKKKKSVQQKQEEMMAFALRSFKEQLGLESEASLEGSVQLREIPEG